MDLSRPFREGDFNFSERPMHEYIDRLSKSVGKDFPNLKAACERTAENVDLARKQLEDDVRIKALDTLSVAVFGSMARQEMTEGSDFDYLILTHEIVDDPQHLKDCRAAVQDVRTRLNFKPPGTTGTFGRVASAADIIDRIGLEEDTDRTLTRRILLLEESVALHNLPKHAKLVERLIDRYLLDYQSRPKPGVPRFLLNDVVRYWRTITVDYQAKKWDELDETWGLRYLKLLISRKLTFAGTVVSLFIPAIMQQVVSNDLLIKQFAMPPLARLAQILPFIQQESHVLAGVQQIFTIAEGFVGRLDDGMFRSEVKKVTSLKQSEKIPAFQEVKADADNLQSALETVFFDSKCLGALSRKYLSF
jgi:predicted nucleotidyltransferase